MQGSGYSHKQSAIDAIALDILRNKTMAINANNKEFIAKHPDWVRAAVKKDFTELTKQCKDSMERYQKLALDRRKRTHGKGI